MAEVWAVLNWTVVVVGWTVTPIILLTFAVIDFREAIKYKHDEFLWTRHMWGGTLYGITGICFPIAAIIAIIRYLSV